MAFVKPRMFARPVVDPLVSRLHSGRVETLTAAGEGELRGRGGLNGSLRGRLPSPNERR